MDATKEQWQNDIDEISSQFQNNFSALSADQLNFKPGPEKWSIAENMEHLIKVNESYFPVVEDVASGNHKIPFFGRFNLVSTFFGNMIHRSVLPDRKRKMRTFHIWEPENSSFTNVLSNFLQHQEILKKKILTLSPDMLNTTVSSPANPAIVYKLHRAFDIIIQHERRHLEQAKEVLQTITTTTV